MNNRHTHGLMNWFRVRMRNKRGVAAVEFAFILPLLVSLYFGVVESTFAIMADRKLTNLTSTVADLVAQTKTVNDAELNDIFEASSAIMAPFDVSNLQIVVSSIVIDAGGSATVEWSAAAATGGTPRPTGSSFVLPAGLDTPNTSLVVAEVVYEHTSFLSYFIESGIELSDVFYLRPRLSDKVTKV